MSLKDLEKRAALQILTYLHKNKSATRTDLRENIEAVMETIYSALEILKELGLIEEIISNFFPKTAEVYLSERGVLVAKRLVEIEEVLQDEE